MKINESLMTMRENGKLHHVKYFNDDTGYGLTQCKLRVYPWTVTYSGRFTCRRCVSSRKAEVQAESAGCRNVQGR